MTDYSFMKNIILASQSPRRKQLLQWAEVPFEVIVANTEENIPPGLNVEDVPVHIAREKAEVAFQKLLQNAEGIPMDEKHQLVLAADTIVVLNNEIIGKPTNRAHAIEILSRLSGQTHRVITGVYILQHDKGEGFADITEVEFHVLSKEQIEYYVDKYQPYDKAGAYAIQEWIGVTGIKSVTGDFYNVMGLPVSRVLQKLLELQEPAD